MVSRAADRRALRDVAPAWRAAPDAAPSVLRAKAEALGELVARLWEEQGRPCSARVVGRALSYARRRAADPAEPVVVHGDPHPGNLLQIRIARPGAESGFVFVDPDGFVAPRAYDLGVVVRDWCPQLSVGDARTTAWGYCVRAAAQTGAAAQAVWEWGFLERVSSGLYACSLGLADIGEPFLATAERLSPDRTRTPISAC
jgi:streptomycin 6-kinase